MTRIAALRRKDGAAGGMPLPREQIEDLLDQLNEILNIAGTFHLWNLVTTAALLYELLRSSQSRHRINPDSLNSFIHAMHLFAIPSGRYEADGLKLLEQLRCLYEIAAPVTGPRLLKRERA